MSLSSALAYINLSLKVKVTLCFCSLIVLTMVSFWLLTGAEFHNTLKQQADTLGKTHASQTANSVRESVLANDLLSLKIVLDQITRKKSILEVSVFDIDGQVLATSQSKTGIGSHTQMDFEAKYPAQISLEDSIAGSIILQLDTSALKAGYDRAQLYFWLILCLGLGGGISIAFLLASYITNPVLDMINAILDPEGHTLPLNADRIDEIGILQSCCADLLNNIKEDREQQESLSGIQNQENASSLHKPLKIMASVLVVKVVNINTAIELLHPSTLSRLLNEYLFYLNQAAKLYGGKVQRFAGESVMVAFDSRQTDEEYTFNAVSCAQLFLKLMAKVAEQHRIEASQALEFRLAIHSGEVFCTFATNAQQEVQNHALIGKVIDTGYFLNKQGKPGQLIISETAFAQAGGEERLSSEGSIEITMPTDKMSFMAYLLNENTNENSELLEKQCRHLLP